MLSRRALAIARAIFPSLMVLLGVVYALAVILSAIVFYRSSQETSYRDIDSLVKPLADLKEIWSDSGELSVLQGVLDQKNQELQAAVADLGKVDPHVDPQVVSSKLQAISANLSYLKEALGHKRGRAAKAVEELETKVAALKDKVGPPAAPEKIIQVLYQETGAIFIAILWPLVVAVIFFYLLRSRRAPERLRALFGGFKSLKLGMAEIVLNESAQTKANTENLFADLRDRAKTQYDLWVQKKNLRQKLGEVVDDVVRRLKNTRADRKELLGYRCTLHVPDTVLDNTLYQLLDYLPTGGGRGRVFDVRFGIIGKVWRRREAETQGEVLGEDKLVQEWGMTPEEAKRAALERPSFLCVPLKDEKEGHVGIFYMDSQDKNAFDIPNNPPNPNNPPEELHDFIHERCRANGLIDALAKMKDELSGRALLIRVHER